MNKLILLIVISIFAGCQHTKQENYHNYGKFEAESVVSDTRYYPAKDTVTYNRNYGTIGICTCLHPIARWEDGVKQKICMGCKQLLREE